MCIYIYIYIGRALQGLQPDGRAAGVEQSQGVGGVPNAALREAGVPAVPPLREAEHEAPLLLRRSQPDRRHVNNNDDNDDTNNSTNLIIL